VEVASLREGERAEGAGWGGVMAARNRLTEIFDDRYGIYSAVPDPTDKTVVSCRELDSRGLQTVADRTSQVSTRRCEQFTLQTQTPHQLCRLWRTV